MLKFLGYFLTIIFCAKSQNFPPDLQEVLQNMHTICLSKNDLTEADHAAFDINEKPQNPKIMCYMKCLLTEPKWMTDDGVIQYDFISKNMHPFTKETFWPMIDKCRDINEGTDPCEKSYNLNVCLHKVNPKHYHFV